jgi:predicted acyl esterase
LRAAPPATTGADRYVYAPGAVPRTDAPKQRAADGVPSFDWRPLPAANAVGYVTAPLAHDTVVAGDGGSVDLWLRAGAPDVDLEVVISEVRPDGQETYVQSGWLRASQRRLASSSTDVSPDPTFLRRDAAPLPSGRDTLVRVPLYPFAHVFRAGSRLRIVVQPPGGNRPAWAFAALRPKGHVTVTVARSAVHPSRVVLPVLTGVAVPTPEPACGALRGQPCRHYVAAANGG